MTDPVWGREEMVQRRLRQQSLILHGDEDPLVPLANARWMAAAMPHARLRVVTGGGHLFLLDEPASVTAALTNFLSETPNEDRHDALPSL
jgi:pimeloyl-ACP methyl ester carboxylesterase